MLPAREDALRLLHEWTLSESLRKHAYGVEGIMRLAAQRAGENPNGWGIAGLMHDFDYEKYPTIPDHPLKGCAVLEELGYPQEIIDAIKGHAKELNVARTTLMAKTLFAVDELSGLVVAAALVRPSRSLDDLEVSSVKKKMKSKAFAASVSREDIYQGAEELGKSLDEVIQLTIDGLRTVPELKSL